MEKENSERLLQALKENEKQGNKENEFKESVPKDQMISAISELQKSFTNERTELKNQLLDLQSKNQKLIKENKELKNSEAELKKSLEALENQNDEDLKEKLATLISDYESEQKKLEVKSKRQLGRLVSIINIEILHEKMYIKDNQIIELQKLISEQKTNSVKVSTKPGEDVSKISEKIRNEYIGAIEALQTNLENLKLKYQKEVSGRKDDQTLHKDEIRDYKRKIKILEEERELKNGYLSNSDKTFNVQLLEEKSKRINLEEERELLHNILASTKAAWAQ